MDTHKFSDRVFRFYMNVFHRREPTREEWNQHGVWITADGYHVHIDEMTERHVINVYWFLRRVAEMQCRSTRLFFLGALPPKGEMAREHYEMEFQFAMEMTPEDYFYGHPFTEHLLDRIERDDIDVEKHRRNVQKFKEYLQDE